MTSAYSIDQNAPLIQATAVIASEFGWTTDYIMFHLPLTYLFAYVDLIQEKHERELAAANGQKTAPKSELSEDRVTQKERLIAKHYSKVDELWDEK